MTSTQTHRPSRPGRQIIWPGRRPLGRAFGFGCFLASGCLIAGCGGAPPSSTTSAAPAVPPPKVISPQYAPTTAFVAGETPATSVNLRVTDGRERSEVATFSLYYDGRLGGNTGDVKWADPPVVVTKPDVAEVVKAAFAKSIQLKGWTLRDDAPLTLDVTVTDFVNREQCNGRYLDETGPGKPFETGGGWDLKSVDGNVGLKLIVLDDKARLLAQSEQLKTVGKRPGDVGRDTEIERRLGQAMSESVDAVLADPKVVSAMNTPAHADRAQQPGPPP